MFLLRYDILLAVQSGCTGDPVDVVLDLGYTDISFKSHHGNSLFLEVFQLNEPLPLFLERSDVVDGRFDPRTTIKRVIPEPIGFGDKTIHFHQDPTVSMTVDFRHNRSENSVVEEEKELEDIQGTKAKRSANIKK